LSLFAAERLRKTDAQVARETLVQVVRPGDILVVTRDAGVDATGVRARKSLLVDEARVLYTDKVLVIAGDGGRREVVAQAAGTRVVVVGRAAGASHFVGRTARVTIGRARITVVHPLPLPGNSWDAVQFLPDALVTREGGGGVRACGFKSGRFMCREEDWKDVGLRELPFDGTARTCIFAHPTSPGRLVIRLTAPARTAAFAVGGGIADQGADYPLGAPVTLRVIGGGAVLGEAVFGNVRGWRAEKVSLARPVEAGASVAFEVTAAGQDARHFCFTATGEGG